VRISRSKRIVWGLVLRMIEVRKPCSSAVKSWLMKHKWDLVAILALLISYAIIYRDVLFAPYVITGVDFQIPSPTPLIPWNGAYTAWAGASLGSPYGIGWSTYAALLNGFFALISGGCLLLAQKFMLMGVFFASIFMYVFLVNHITKLRPVAFMGALIYAYGPATVNFGTGNVWQLALFPIVLNFVFNILSSKPRLRDSAFLALSLDFMTGYGLDLFVFLPIIFFIFLLLNLREFESKIAYLKNTLKFTILGLVLFAVSDPPFLLTVMSFLPIPSLLPAQGNAASLGSVVSVSQFYSNYGSVPFLGWFTESYGLVQSLVPFLGCLLPIMAFMALVIARRRQSRKLALGFSSVFVVVLLFVVMVIQKSPMFVWLYNNFVLIKVLRGPTGVLFITSFLIVTLTALTVNELMEWFLNAKFTVNWKLKKKALSVTLVSLILISFFAYVPAFLQEEHVNGQGYANSPNNTLVEVPPVYSLIVNWMEEKGVAGSFRYMLLPSPFSSSLALPNWYPYQFAPAQGSPLTNQYVYYSISTLLSGQTDQWGRLLAPAGVKYIFVVWNTTETNLGNGATAWMAQGEPSIQANSRPCGSYEDYIELLGTQKDLRLLINASNYLIYENLDYLPQVSIFSSLAYVVGDLDAINTLGNYPAFQINDTLLAFSDQPNSLDALNYATSVVFDNRDVQNLLMNSIAEKYAISLIDYGSSESGLIGTSWVQATAEQNYITTQGIPTSGLLTSTAGFIETTGNSVVNANFSVQTDGEYQIWLCALYAPVSTGNLRFLLDGQAVNLSIQTSSRVFEGFEWINLGAFKLGRGTHTLGILNSGGYNAVNELGIVPETDMEQAMHNLSQVLGTKQLLYVFNTASHNVETSTIEISNSSLMSYDLAQYRKGYSWGNLSVIQDGDVAPYSVINFGPAESSSPRQVLGYVFPSQNRSLSGWDYLRLWVKTSSNLTQVWLYTNVTSNDIINYWSFDTQPGQWSELTIPLSGSNFSYVDGIQIHALAGYPNENVSIELNHIELVKMESILSTTVYLPIATNYSIGCFSATSIADSVLSIDNTVLPTESFSENWTESSTTYLSSGYHNITIMLPHLQLLELLAISTEDLKDVTDQSIAYSVGNSGNSEYAINIQSGAKPVFIMLSEAYSDGWSAYTNGRQLPHFYAYSFLNGFYLNDTGNSFISIKYEGQQYLVIIWLGLLAFLGTIIIGIADTYFEKRKSMPTKMRAPSLIVNNI